MSKLENDFIVFWKEGSVLYSEFKYPVDMTIEKMKELIELRHQISKGEKQYWCYDISNLREFPKELREYADIHGQEFLYATGVVVNSHITRLLVNLYTKLTSPKMPLKFFMNKEDSVSWLNDLKEENKS